MWLFKSKLRVLTVGSVPPEWGGERNGGVAVVHRQLVEALRDGGASQGIRLVGTVGTNSTRSAANSDSRYPLLTPPGETRSEKDWYLQVLRSTRPDCVIFFHIAHRWAKYHAETNVPMVGAVHSWTPVTKMAPEKRVQKELFLKSMLARCDALVMPSFHTVQEGQSLGFYYPHLPNVVHNALSDHFSREQETDLPGRRAKRIISVGQLTPIKRFELSIRSAAYLGAEMVLIGDGADRGALAMLGTQLLGEHAFRHTGYLPQERVRLEMLNSGLYCGPSQTESFGNTYIEALSCGLPVVGFEPTLTEIQNVLQVDVGIGIKGDGSFDDVVGAVDEVMRCHWNRSALAAATRREFSSQRMSAGYADAVRRAVS